MIRPACGALAAVLALAPWLARAAPSDLVLARGPGAVTVTTADLRTLLATLPPDTAAAAAHDPQALAELVRDAALQAALLAEATAQGWTRRPEVVAAANRARTQAIIQSYLAHKAPPSPPSEAELRAAYEANKSRLMRPRQFHLAQIFLAVPATAPAPQAQAARQRLLALRALAVTPASFAQTATRSSEDRQSAPAGGDLGWISEDKLAPAIRAAVAGLTEGAVTDPLRTDDGWHLIALLATRPAAPTPFEQLRPALARTLAQQRQQQADRAYLDAMLQRAPVAIDQRRIAQFAHAAPPTQAASAR